MKSQARAQGTYFPWPWRNASQSGGLLSVNARLSGRKGRAQESKGFRDPEPRLVSATQQAEQSSQACARCWFGREDRDSTMILGLMGMIRIWAALPPVILLCMYRVQRFPVMPACLLFCLTVYF